MPLAATSRFDLDARAPIATWATTTAGAARVFARHRLDFCCHGTESLTDACRGRGLDPEAVIEEIVAELPAEVDFARWDLRPLGELIDHVLEQYHARHRAELPRLLSMAEKVEAVHRDKAACPVGLREHLERMAEELEAHMQKEEQILFPLLRAGNGALAHCPIQVMEMEHDQHAVNLARMRELAHDFEPPADACGTWRALYLGLAELEQEVMRHIHLENHVLFPRALGA